MFNDKAKQLYLPVSKKLAFESMLYRRPFFLMSRRSFILHPEFIPGKIKGREKQLANSETTLSLFEREWFISEMNELPVIVLKVKEHFA